MEPEALPIHRRLPTIDIARGIIMVIMALDHVRDYFHKDALLFSPTDLDKTNCVLFLTRWVTHFCAPAFVLLAGVSIAISSTRKTKKELTRYLLTRGLWLIVLDVTVMRLGLLFNFYYDVTFLGVLWMIGFCMMCMAALIYLPQRWMLIMGLLILFLHNALDAVSIDPGQWFSDPWMIAMRAGFLPVDAEHGIVTSYALVPWLSVMMMGYSLGSLYRPEIMVSERKKWLLTLGFTSLMLFVVLRGLNLYGDPVPWSVQHEPIMSALSFINVTKYPVSLQFVLVTVGPLLILLGLLERSTGNVWKPFLTIGRVPLFYFVVHFYLLHAAALLLMMWQTGTSFSDIDFHFSKSFGGIVAGAGISLAGVYVAWLTLVVTVYPFCRLYERYKSMHKNKLLSYL